MTDSALDVRRRAAGSSRGNTVRELLSMRRGLRARILVASAALAVLVATAFAAMLLTVHTLHAEGRLSQQSEEVIATADELELQLIDIETGARGFLIAGDKSFLAPYTRARHAYRRIAARLARLVADNDVQMENARRIDRAIRTYDHSWAFPLVRTARRNLPDARALVATGGGKRQVDALRALRPLHGA